MLSIFKFRQINKKRIKNNMKKFLLFSSLMNQKDIKSEEEEDNEFGK